MEIKKENIMAAFNAADENGKQMLRALFPGIEEAEAKQDNRPVTERIKTFEDARKALGENHPMVITYDDLTADFTPDNTDTDLIAYFKLRIIAAALNEGWEPQFTQDEWRWYPWFCLWTDEELASKSEEWKQELCLRPMTDHRGEWAGLAYAFSDYAPSNTSANVGSRLCFKSESLATYAGKQFIDLWMDFYLISK